jgi:hypothetical protein
MARLCGAHNHGGEKSVSANRADRISKPPPLKSGDAAEIRGYLSGRRSGNACSKPSCVVFALQDRE